MTKKAKNSNLSRAKKAKNDEFYTQATDIEKELKHYRKHFNGKVVYCNCDDPTYSEFWRYFHLNFHFLGLKELISTHYDRNNATYALFYRGGNSEHDDNDFNKYDEKRDLKQDGDFRSEESIELLKRADIVVTNEPFSLLREYVAQLMEYHKKFLIIVNKNAITYKEIFPLLKDNQIWMGVNNVHSFRQPDGSFKKFGNVGWFTNLPVKKASEKMVLFKQFNIDEFPVYDNYAAFNVDKVAHIPQDSVIEVELNNDRLDGFRKTYGDDFTILKSGVNSSLCRIVRPIWGVPITFMDKYNPSGLVDRNSSTAQQLNWPNDSVSSGCSTTARTASGTLPSQPSMASSSSSGLPSDNLAERFYIVGATESEGRGFSDGVFNEQSRTTQPLVDDQRKYKRLFIREYSVG